LYGRRVTTRPGLSTVDVILLEVRLRLASEQTPHENRKTVKKTTTKTE
jgi:hypothetical protein